MKPVRKLAKPNHAVTLYRGLYGEDKIPVHVWVDQELKIDFDVCTVFYPKEQLMRKTLDAVIAMAVIEYRKFVGARLGGD